MLLRLSFVFIFFVLSLSAQERPLYQASFKSHSTGIFLPVSLNGQECTFLFDTGASFVVLDKSFRHLLGEPLSLEEAQARTGIEFASKYIITPNGKIKLEMFQAISLKLGPLQIANRFPYILADLQSLWPFAGEKFCGILGMSFLHQFRWEIDFEHSTVKGYVGAEPYGGKYSAKTPIFWSHSHIPQVFVNLQGKQIAFDIDTGDNGSGRIRKENLIFLEGQSQILASQKQDIITVSSLSVSEEYRLRAIRFANVLYPKIVMQESGQNAIGLHFLKRHDIVFDFPFSMLYLQHHKDYAKVQSLDKSGVRIILQDNKLIVFSVKPQKGARLKGIKKGDEILSVKGVDNLDLYTVRKLTRGAEGKELFMKVIREGEILDGYVRLGAEPLCPNN